MGCRHAPGTFSSPRRCAPAAALALAWACGGVDESSGSGCEDVDAGATCTPVFEGDFNDLFERILSPRCANAAACHGEGTRTSLALPDSTEAYRALVDDGRVVPGWPGCGPLMMRLEATDPRWQMPPGAPLSPAERCVVTRWIADGAPAATPEAGGYPLRSVAP